MLFWMPFAGVQHRSADTKLIQAPFYSGIEIESYQLDPVVRAVQMPRVSLLVADDVGLGKTIEAGLVVRELMLRHRALRILVVCPATLQIKWRDEMLEKFGLEFHIVDTTLIRSLGRERGLRANPWNHFPRLITSMDYVKRETPLRLFREAVSRTAMSLECGSLTSSSLTKLITSHPAEQVTMRSIPNARRRYVKSLDTLNTSYS